MTVADVHHLVDTARRVPPPADAAPADTVPLLSLAELSRAAGLTSWLVKRAIPTVAIGMLFGASQTFKSFIALDCALHVAHGLPWMGRRTRKGAVIYIAAEGGAGMWKRIDAWHRSRGLPWNRVSFHVVPVALDLAADAMKVVASASAVGVKPALVVVDTVSQTYAGEENSANEMAAYLRALGQAFRDLWSCAVLLIHHAGHQATERPRGSSAITSNVDFLFGSHRDEKEMLATLSCLKQKDEERFADQTFALSVKELGTDSDGDTITSLVARHLSTEQEIREALAGEQTAGRAGRAQLLLGLVQTGMAEKELRLAFCTELGGLDAEAKRKAFYRARNWAVQSKLIEVAQGVIIDLRERQ
ncbi:MAG: AAA family ATPase [Rubrivivax sp.]